MGQTLVTTLTLSCLLLSSALTAGPSLYPQPVTPLFEEGDDQLTCSEMELQLTSLLRQTYSVKPGFYNDPYHGASIWAGTLWAPGAWSYLAYSGAAEYTEYARIRDAQRRIEALRHLKARRRCHE
ncbi:MAG: hypothetical protein KZQ93_04520 [Candidatus Thiodiazotropha sp. (ex Monitilora ramsayi)]|nr:hypothetical protein [Candidatus Thiodiazotropha sp. (ex Monitilora ramsayi)]